MFVLFQRYYLTDWWLRLGTPISAIRDSSASFASKNLCSAICTKIVSRNQTVVSGTDQTTISVEKYQRGLMYTVTN